ncbi:CHAD domain-containing protein [Pseudomonas sp. N040]|uniref:CHAD domain-containing protein n=1 Tax=Pseudomonas sp. N040 TaxID=2785325 RepID=UPI0018A27A0A|nr:CHAD domain-containing protein [Pseudomonas sp. N040]MBF7729465.1 CHAD domain-containing protein [Pseudomonas sp. N040]MBW7013105.1 CHAD domain-containing protein [Pseudomonas sp. N040]
MKRFAETLLVRIEMLDIRLRSCHARLADASDAEALHDQRICLRTLRSLLRPLRGLPLIDLLEPAAAALGRRSNALRELQVFVAELERQGLSAAAAERRQGLQPAIEQLLGCPELAQLLELLDGFPRIWRLAGREGYLRGLRQRIRRQFRRDLRKLPRSLHAAGDDLHALRLRVKRLRYGCAVYPGLSRLSSDQQKLLQEMQQALGDWNDCQHWLGSIRQDARLECCRAAWQAHAEAAANRAASLLQRFSRQQG